MDLPTITRRQLLQSAALATAWAALSACTGNQPNTPHPPTPAQPTPLPANLMPATNAETHLLRRISFGPRPGDIDHVKSIGLAAYIEEQLNYETLSDSEERIANLTLLSASPADLLAQLKAKQLNLNQVLGELVSAKFLRALYSPQQLREVMIDFWSDHFNIYALKSPDGVLKPADDRDVIRPHALGKFRDLLSASAHSPAMLLYLDNATSVARAPNENYAREIMELHTLSVNGGYTQLDVHEVARALTGWSVVGLQDAGRLGNAQVGRFLYRSAIHDNGAKTILGVNFPANGGQAEGEKVLDLLAAQPATAKFIAEKLCVRFVSDNPPAAIVDRTAATFAQTDGDIKAMVRTILTSDEFAAAIGQKYKRPFEFLVSALRALSADISLDTSGGSQPGGGLRRNPVFQYLLALGQVPFMWSTPDGYPDKEVSWLSTNGLLHRWNFGLALATGVKGVSINSKALVGPIQSNNELVDRVAEVLLGAVMVDPQRAILIDYARSVPDNLRLPGLLALMVGSSQFQVR